MSGDCISSPDLDNNVNSDLLSDLLKFRIMRLLKKNMHDIKLKILCHKVSIHGNENKLLANR